MNEDQKRRSVALQIKVELVSRELDQSMQAIDGYLERNKATPGIMTGLSLLSTAQCLLDQVYETLPPQDSQQPAPQGPAVLDADDDTMDGIEAAEWAGDPGLALRFPDPWTELVNELVENGMTSEEAEETLIRASEELLQLTLQVRERANILFEGEFRPASTDKSGTATTA